jgi:hypothetical protein
MPTALDSLTFTGKPTFVSFGTAGIMINQFGSALERASAKDLEPTSSPLPELYPFAPPRNSKNVVLLKTFRLQVPAAPPTSCCDTYVGFTLR